MFKSIAFTVFTILFIFAGSSCANLINKPSDSPANEALSANQNEFELSRKTFETKLLKTGPSPQEYQNETPPKGVSEIQYKSGKNLLKAWIFSPYEYGTNHPAVVYVHGGLAFGKDDWTSVQPYINAGYIVMAPMLRAENGNPGNFEYFYGEVDDVIAAGNYLASLSYVDPQKIFLSGHSTGGTLAMLVSMLPGPYKAIASFGASPDQKDFFRVWKDEAPFDVHNDKEILMRSPVKHLQSIQNPLFVYTGKKDVAYFYSSAKMVEDAKQLGKHVEFIPVEGNHFTSLETSINDSITRFKQF